MKNMTKKIFSMLLVVALLVTVSSSGAMLFATISAESNVAFGLDVEANVNADDSSLIDVVITAKDFQEELVAVEFNLNFDKNLVAGVITENDEAQMDVFMTKVPTYHFSYSGVEAQVPCYEQLCYYDAENGNYECRFVDLMEYPYAKDANVESGLINDGDLVVTIQFRILDGVAEDAEFAFSATDVLGVTSVDLDGVAGSGDSAVAVRAEDLFDISFASMTMGNSLAINFAFEKSAMDSWTGCYAEIVKTYADGRSNAVETVPVANWKSTTINGSAHYYVTYNNVSAKEMTDDIYVTIYDVNGEAVSNTKIDSVRAQSMRTLVKSGVSAEERTMVVDMLNYGAAAQKYFSYDTGDLANAQLTETQKGYASQPASCTNSRTSSGNFVASTVVLKSNIQMMFAFKNVDASHYAVVTFNNHRGTAKNVTIPGSQFTANGSAKVVTVDALVVADGRQNVTCVVHDANGNEVARVTDSLASYSARSTDDLFVKMMQYSDSAYNYFH